VLLSSAAQQGCGGRAQRQHSRPNLYACASAGPAGCAACTACCNTVQHAATCCNAAQRVCVAPATVPGAAGCAACAVRSTWQGQGAPPLAHRRSVSAAVSDYRSGGRRLGVRETGPTRLVEPVDELGAHCGCDCGDARRQRPRLRSFEHEALRHTIAISPSRLVQHVATQHTGLQHSTPGCNAAHRVATLQRTTAEWTRRSEQRRRSGGGGLRTKWTARMVRSRCASSKSARSHSPSAKYTCSATRRRGSPSPGRRRAHGGACSAPCCRARVCH
jgi:hypothetical protein